MTQQEIIERDVRITIGDLSLQLIMTRARVQELEQIVAQLEAALAAKEPEQPAPTKVNGKDRRPEGAAPS